MDQIIDPAREFHDDGKPIHRPHPSNYISYYMIEH
jgi:hypothetical protein